MRRSPYPRCQGRHPAVDADRHRLQRSLPVSWSALAPPRGRHMVLFDTERRHDFRLESLGQCQPTAILEVDNSAGRRGLQGAGTGKHLRRAATCSTPPTFGAGTVDVFDTNFQAGQPRRQRLQGSERHRWVRPVRHQATSAASIYVTYAHAGCLPSTPPSPAWATASSTCSTPTATSSVE